ncbi:MAG: alpha/beta hydrolase [Planctomycetes bacterium]|nr:alpha/beta hydrolase [Planctomycetota bacterium]
MSGIAGKNGLRASLVAAACMAAAFLAGCGQDYYAKELVQPGTARGKMKMRLAGTEKELFRENQIQDFRRIAVDEDTVIDVWLVKGRPTAGVEIDVTFTAEEITGCVVLLHDLGDSKASCLDLAHEIAGLGCSVLLIDIRMHGRSGGEYVTWGIKESLDVKLIVDTMMNGGEIEPPVFAMGLSVGGLMAIQYAAADPRCRGVLAVAPPKDVHYAAKRMFPYLTDEQVQAVVAKAGMMASFDPAQASAIKAAGKLVCPLYIVHGTADTFMPMESSKEILAAAKGPKELIEAKFAGRNMLDTENEKWLAQQFARMAQKAGKIKPSAGPATRPAEKPADKPAGNFIE